ncbi:hypothetical protein [Thermosediminibacter oceani]|uniref:FlgN family protein n=1 Tax=Thermosediminibacter oceani (strain ATCC BAA-1034 / DSM 16646 / JW/IW-1228P) TaxID=555079 RepID=D9RY95_THEOJ|nr:hypothetical protein [Thermosediminibacter oceani]ADL08319.1 hypothetical protein Toce_1577 [Thermosediminibacter oceani DSM 16646]
MVSEEKDTNLTVLLKKKKNTLENIKKLTAEMIKALEDERHEEFMALLPLRREAMDESGRIDDKILQEAGGRENFALMLKERESAFHVNEIRKVLNELKAFDDELNEKARKAIEGLQQKIDEHYRTKKAYTKYRNLYENAVIPFGAFIDEKK